MPENKDFELDDLDSFSFEEISLDAEDAENETLSVTPESNTEDPFGVWVKQAPEASQSTPETPESLEEAETIPDLDFLTNDELANLDLNTEGKPEELPSLDSGIPDLSLEDEFNTSSLSVEETPLEDVSGDFDEVSLDDFVDFQETEDLEAPQETISPTSLEVEPEEEFLDIDIEIEDDIDDRELEIMEGAHVKREEPEIQVEAIAGAEEIDLSEFGDFGIDEDTPSELEPKLELESELESEKVESEIPVVSETEETELEIPDMEPLEVTEEVTEDMSEPPLFADVNEEDLRLDTNETPLESEAPLENETKDFFLEPDGIFEETLLDAEDEMDMERIIALENDLTKGIAEPSAPVESAPVEKTASTEDKDLAARVLLKIESELSSIKQELSDLKKELSNIKVVPSPETGPLSESNSKAHHGFFDEDEDETIALTGDELDNIFSTAEINETELSGETLEPEDSEELIAFDSEGSPLEPEPEISSSVTTDEEFLAGTALAETDQQSLELPEFTEELPLPGETQLGVPESIELEEDFSSDLDLPEAGEEDDATDNLLVDSLDEMASDSEEETEEETEMEQVSSAVFEIESPLLDIPFDDEIKLEEEPEAEPEFEAETELKDETEDSEELTVESLFEETPADITVPSISETESELNLQNVEPYEPQPTPEPLPTLESQATPPAVTSTSEVSPQLKTELKAVLGYMDKLLASLPDDKIQEFAESEHFEVYKKLFEELGLVE